MFWPMTHCFRLEARWPLWLQKHGQGELIISGVREAERTELKGQRRRHFFSGPTPSDKPTPTRLRPLLATSFQQLYQSMKPLGCSSTDEARALRIQLLLCDWTTSWGPSRRYMRRTHYVQSTPVVLVQAYCPSIIKQPFNL